MPAEVLDETAKQILDAASRRFLHYGYGKTTMSEIAQDCNMSTGNLYRYFPSKLDIAEMFVRVLRREQVAQLRTVADDPSLTPPERLSGFFMRKFQLSYERFHDKPKAYELSRELLTDRPKVAIEWENAEARVLTEILLSGDQSGSFAIDNVSETVKVLQDATYRFTSPTALQDGGFEELSGELTGLMGLILDGFAWRASKRAAADKRKHA